MFWLVIIEGIWIFYNFLTMLYGSLPFINLIEEDFLLIDIFSVFALRWSPVISIFLVVVGILGIVLSKKTENNLQSVKIPALVFGSIFSIVLIL